MAKYGAEITSDDIQTFLDETASEVLLPPSDLLDASFPEFTENADKTGNYIFSGTGLSDNIIPSGIPNAIDKLWKYNNRVPDIDPPVSPVLKLKGKLITNYKLEDNYNGICINLDTTGYLLKIEQGSVLVAL